MTYLQKKVLKYLETVHVLLLSSCSLDGDGVNGRYMEIQQVDDDLTIWFITHKSSLKVQEFQKNPRCCINSFNSDILQDLKMFGMVELTFDPALRDALWDEDMRAYFPEGKEDAEFCLLKFTPYRLEFRDTLTGSPPEVEEMQEH